MQFGIFIIVPPSRDSITPFYKQRSKKSKSTSCTLCRVPLSNKANRQCTHSCNVYFISLSPTKTITTAKKNTNVYNHLDRKYLRVKDIVVVVVVVVFVVAVVIVVVHVTTLTPPPPSSIEPPSKHVFLCYYYVPCEICDTFVRSFNLSVFPKQFDCLSPSVNYLFKYEIIVP